MCSDSSSSGGGSSGGDGGGWTMASKKLLKGRKVPKRGPGVAELEKILREQEKKDTTADTAEISEGQSPRFVSSLPKPYHSQPRPPLHISPSSSLVVPNLAQFSQPPPPPMTIIYANGSSSTILGRGGGGGRGVCVTGGSGVVLPEQPLFAITFSSCKSNMDRVDGSNSDPGIPLRTHFPNESNPQYCPSPNLLQMKQGQYHAIMVNQNFPESATPSLTSSSAGMYHLVEPPSNQRSCLNYTSNWPEEEKVLGIMRRPKPFSVGNSPGPQFHVQSSSCDDHSAFDFEPTNTISRDTRWGGPLDINSNKCITTACGEPQNNFYTFGSPTIPSPTTQSLKGELSKYDLLPIQESMEDSHVIRPGPGGVDCKKPFHGFSQLKEQVGRKELALSLNNERGEAEGDGIDLNLKL